MRQNFINPKLTDSTYSNGRPGNDIAAEDSGRNEFLYFRAESDIGAHFAVLVGTSGAGRLLTKDRLDSSAGVPICWPLVDVAEGEFAWGLVAGRGLVQVSANASTGLIYTSGTSGQLDDSSSGQTRIRRLALVAAGPATAGPALAELIHPSLLNLT